jgi:hypothetical protein
MSLVLVLGSNTDFLGLGIWQGKMPDIYIEGYKKGMKVGYYLKSLPVVGTGIMLVPD